MNKKHSILILDDHAPSVEVMARKLLEAGYHVRTCGCGYSCLEVLKLEAPDLVLMEVGIPKKCRDAVLRFLREQPHLQETWPVILTRTPPAPCEEQRDLEDGIHDYIVHTDMQAEFMARIRAFFRQREILEKLQRKNALLGPAAEAAHQVLMADDFESGIQKSLAVIGEAAGQDRAYIFELHLEDGCGEWLASQRFEWVREGVVPQIDNVALQKLRLETQFPKWYRWLQDDRVISGTLEDFPPAERDLLNAQGIISLLIVPVKIGKHLWGMIGFDNCHCPHVWTEDEQCILRATGNALAAALQRHTMDKALRESERRFHQLLEKVPNLAVIGVDMQGRIQEWNAAAVNMFGYSREEVYGQGCEPLLTFRKGSSSLHELFRNVCSRKCSPGLQEILIRHQSGGAVPVYCSIVCSGDAPSGICFCLAFDLRGIEVPRNAAGAEHGRRERQGQEPES